MRRHAPFETWGISMFLAPIRSAARKIATVAILSVSTLGTAAFGATPLVDSNWVNAHLNDDNVVILDIRSPVGGSSKDDYLKGHVPGAIHSAYPGPWRTTRDGVDGVLPSVEKLEAYLSELGVAEGKTVVIVPAGNTSLDFGAAARIYWTFKVLGHDDVSILDGGYADWISDASRPVETGDVTPVGDLFVAELRPELNISTPDVEKIVADKPAQTVLLDARPEAFYLGKKRHPAAERFGRLPGSVNLDHDTFFDAETGRLKPTDALQSAIPADLSDKALDIVSYCNTGHWAATDWFVMSELLGYENVRMYDESMVGWTHSPDRVVDSDRTRLDDLKDWIASIGS